MAEFRILGPLEVGRDGEAVDLGPPKQRALLAILLLDANQIVPVDRLIDDLWGDTAPRQAAHAIQVYVSELRRLLEPIAGREVISWRPPGYILSIDPAQLDAKVAEQLVAKGTIDLESGNWAAADRDLERARGLWRGPPLCDFVYEEFAQNDIRHLTEVWLSGTEALAQVRLHDEDPDAVLLLAEAAIREDPFRERPRQLQMLALCQLDRPTEALRAYQSYSRLIAGELDAKPTQALQHLHERILVHDAALTGDTGTRPALATAQTQAQGPARNPYKGLRAFGEHDAADFFGRQALVERIVDVIRAGTRLVTLVGPSGSGKSSVLAAGLVPTIRSGAIEGSARWAVRRIRPGHEPVQALKAALAVDTGVGERLLVIDQLEEAFDLADATEADLFLDLLTNAVTEDGSRTRAVLALRADYYGRPLLHATFSAAFEGGVVNVAPMTATELESAIVEPARRVAIDVEAGLLAELVADSVGRAGALPLLQDVLSELFELRDAELLRVADYQAIGGLRGALSRRADDVFGALDAEQQAAAHQVLLRLLWLGEGNRATPRRVQVSELVELALDPIVLSEVLRRFESERLLTFDRDPASGATTVEVAHESLLTEWPRVAGWIEQSRLDLLRHAVLSARVQEWLAAGRQTEDLLIGNRLAEVESWARGSTLRLTSDEAAFLGLAVERRRLEEAEHVAREQRRRGLERGARFRLGGFIGTAVLLVAVIAYAAIAWPGPAPHAVLVYPGMGDNGMYDSIKRGFDGAVARLGLDAQTVIEQPETLRDRLHRLADQGVRLIVVGYAWSNPDVELVARDHPETQFLASDYWGTLPNVWHPRMAFEEGAFLVGAAAALQTETGAVGIIVPADSNLDWAYPGGFEAGAHTVDRDIDVRTAYLTEPPRYGDVTYTDVNRAARDMYRGGADVVFFSGRTGALGLFEAAASESTAQGRQMWAVGVNTDWYVALPFVASLERMDAGPWREHVFTSLITRFDLGISALLEEHVAGSTTPAVRRFGLADGAFELASSGDFIAEHGPQLAALRAQIVAGQIVVPEYPADRGPPR